MPFEPDHTLVHWYTGLFAEKLNFYQHVQCYDGIKFDCDGEKKLVSDLPMQTP